VETGLDDGRKILRQCRHPASQRHGKLVQADPNGLVWLTGRFQSCSVPVGLIHATEVFLALHCVSLDLTLLVMSSRFEFFGLWSIYVKVRCYLIVLCSSHPNE